jgi:cell division protein FtsB
VCGGEVPLQMVDLPARIRWDRVGRVALLLVLLLLVYLYVGPVRSWWSTWQDSKAKRAEIVRLERENAALRARRAALQNPRALEREARKMGMVRPDERPFVVRGLPR